MNDWTDEEFEQWISGEADEDAVREAYRKQSESATAEAER